LLVSAANKNISLLSALCGIARSCVSQATARHSGNELLQSGLNHIISFIAAVLAELVELHSVNDAQLRILYPFIVDGVRGQIKSKDLSELAVQQWLQCSCIIASQVSRKVTLASPLIDGVAAALFRRFKELSDTFSGSKEFGSRMKRDVVMGLVVFLQYQQVT
jgi:hypothetical protein